MITEKNTRKNHFATTDIALVAYLNLQGVNHCSLNIGSDGDVEFHYSENVKKYLDEYFTNRARVSPLIFKVELDKNKRVVFGFLRSRGVR